MQIQRKSYSEINRTYFFTATIHQWLPLLAAKGNKELIVDYLKELSVRKMIKIYGFVIMPNHVHFTCLPAGKSGNNFIKIERKHHREFFKIYGT